MFNTDSGKRIGLFLTVTILCWSLSGCAVMIIGAALSAKKEGAIITPIYDRRYKVTYNGENAEDHWVEACKRACTGDGYKVLSQEEIVRPKGLPGWTGSIECGAAAATAPN